jgi:hypothetical protein
MADIQWIYNLTSGASWAASLGNFTWQINPPDFTPDEIVIRAINFNTANPDPSMYVLWWNVTNSYIASFCGNSFSTSSPQTRIWVQGQVPNTLQFKIYKATVGGISPAASITGDLTISMDFIKYRRTTQEK